MSNNWIAIEVPAAPDVVSVRGLEGLATSRVSEKDSKSPLVASCS